MKLKTKNLKSKKKKKGFTLIELVAVLAIIAILSAAFVPKVGNYITEAKKLGEGHGNPLQCSCLENPGDGGACWAAVYGVAQSRTRLKRLSSSSSSFP